MRFYCRCGKRLTYLQWLEGHCEVKRKSKKNMYYGRRKEFCSISQKPMGKDYSIVLNKQNQLKKVDKDMTHHSIKWSSDLHSYLDRLWKEDTEKEGEKSE